MLEALSQDRAQRRRLRLRSRVRRRALALAALTLLILWMAALNRLAADHLTPWVRRQLVPFLRGVAAAGRTVIHREEVSRMLPGIPIHPGLRYDDLLTLLYWTNEANASTDGHKAAFPTLTLVFRLEARPRDVAAWYRRRLPDWREEASPEERLWRFTCGDRSLGIAFERSHLGSGFRADERVVLRYTGPSPGHRRVTETRRALLAAFGRSESSPAPSPVVPGRRHGE